MRVAPLGLTRKWSAEEAFKLAAEAAALTHGHASGYLSAGALAFMIRRLIDARDLTEAAEECASVLAPQAHGEETRTAILRALETDERRPYSLPAVKHLGEGWVGEEALSIGLHSALLGSSFPEVLTIAANHDGDSDSTA